MAIVYPIELPVTSSPRIVTMKGVCEASITESPFTSEQQVQSYPVDRWQAEIEYPPLDLATAEELLANMLSLYGPYGTFLQGDDNRYVPQGFAAGRTNLLRFTEQLDNAIWSKSASGVAVPTVTANAVADPNSNVFAEQIDFPATAGGQFSQILQVAPGRPILRGKTVTFSIHLKWTGATTINMVVNLVDGSGTFISALVNAPQNVTAAWQRFSVSFSLPSTGAGVGLQVGLQNPGPQGAKTVYAWGAQLEKASAMSTYLGFASGARVNGAGQSGRTLATAWDIFSQTVLKAGDYLVLRALGTTPRFHKCVSDVVTDGGGLASVNLFPGLRETPNDGDLIFWLDCRGLFRLGSDSMDWTIDEALKYGLKFAAMEAY